MESFFIPPLAFIALLLTAATAIAFRFSRTARGSRALPAYLALVLAVAGTVVTRGVLVPAMFSLRAAGENAIEMQKVYDSFGERVENFPRPEEIPDERDDI